MKKILPVLALILLFTPTALALSASERVTVQEVYSDNRTLVLTRENDAQEWLAHIKTCGEDFTAGQSLTLNVDGEFNGASDSLQHGGGTACPLDQAVKINGRVTVNDVTASNTEAVVTTPAGDQYRLQYGPDCANINGYRQNRVIYLMQAAAAPAVSDTIYLPGNDGTCQVRDLRLIGPSQPSETAESQVPTTVTHLRAVAGNQKVYLYWYPASGGAGIDHYVVGYNRYPFDPNRVKEGDIPQQKIVRGTQTVIGNLSEDHTYYFSVLAVDKKGQRSSDWSERVTGRPLSSLGQVPTQSSGSQAFNLRVENENAKAFTVGWERVPGVTTQRVSLEVNGKRTLTYANYTKNTIVIRKSDTRRGKTLRLKVLMYDRRGPVGEESLSFSF